MSDAFEHESPEADVDRQNFNHWGGSSSSDSDGGNENDSFTVAKKKHSFGRKESLHTRLGGGKVANTVLWRNKPLSAGILAGVTVTWLISNFTGLHLLSLINHFLIFVLTVLFVWSKVSSMIEKPLPEIPEISLPEDVFFDTARILNYELNEAIKIFRSIALGKDWTEFLVVTMVLWTLAVVGSCFDILTLLYIVFVPLYTLPAIYEKYENRVETAAHTAMVNFYRHCATIESKILCKIPGSSLCKKH